MTNKSAYTFFIIITCLLFIEICAKSFCNPFLPNLLLIYFTYMLYVHKPLYRAILCLIAIEIVSFVQTGIAGLSSIILIPIAVHFEALKKLLYTKLLTPCLCILIYEIMFETFVSWNSCNSYAYTHTLIRIIVNEFVFLIVAFVIPSPTPVE